MVRTRILFRYAGTFLILIQLASVAVLVHYNNIDIQNDNEVIIRTEAPVGKGAHKDQNKSLDSQHSDSKLSNVPETVYNWNRTIFKKGKRVVLESEAEPSVHEPSDLDEATLQKANSLDEVLPEKYVKITGHRSKNVFLTIGIPSVKRSKAEKEDSYYLFATLKSLKENSSPEDQDRVVILIFLSDFDKDYNEEVKGKLHDKYDSDLKSGYIQVMEVDKAAYPPLTDLKQNFNDDSKRVYWRAKQVMDFAFMFYYARDLSEYYLQLEDDVISAPNYVKEIEEFIKAQQMPWVSLQFSILGFIGKLFESGDLEQLSKFFKLFYEEMPVDWLYPIFCRLLAHPKAPLKKPTLFQHMGKVSSLDLDAKQNRIMLKDKFFKTTVNNSHQLEEPSNPPAKVFTTIEKFKDSKPYNAYKTDKGMFFWGQEPNFKDTFTVVLKHRQRVKAIEIDTGHPEKGTDFLRSANLVVGTAVNFHGGEVRGQDLCDGQYKTIGTLIGGSLLVTDLERLLPQPIDCIRILVTGAQVDWVAINTVSLWTL